MMRWIKGLQSAIARVSSSPNVLETGNGSNVILNVRRSFSSRFREDWPPAMSGFRSYCANSKGDPSLNRDFLAKLFVADRKMEREIEKRGRRSVRNRRNMHRAGVESGSQEKRRMLKEPPLSQSTIDCPAPASPEEVQIAPLLARSNLLVTRDIEWANLMVGFEQESKYAIVDACFPQSPAGFIWEQSNPIMRQLLRNRRPFVARVTDAMGNELFQVRRPFWWVTSSIYAEVNGKEVGVVHRRWHLWRRIYDLYVENKQFAVVENPGFWNWTFTLKDIDGNVLAEIERDWRGFGYEMFTDAGHYAIRFGSSDSSCKTGTAASVEDLEVIRPLTLSERAVTLALAISLDTDYFSRHGGWGLPIVLVGE